MRKIDKIILHCSATPEGRNVTVNDISRWHRDRGFNEIGYHWVIYLDGSVHPGRPESKIGAHTVGHNATSIGVCYIGGTDAKMKAKDTRTPAQREAIKKLVAELQKRYPGATVHGHNEFAAKACPSFNVKIEF
ncbi:MAG: N-acetylmuramoyl-L-alanine amidase [Hespellia sp.]|nr:N-acetylmuramoyl-L-alanine amidase [Hespellia sp.]